MKHLFWQETWGRWVLLILGWTLLGLLFVPETYFFFLYKGDAISWSRTVALTLANGGIALLFLPLIVWLTRRFPIDQHTWRRSLLIHIPACVVFSLSHSWLYAALCYASPLFHMLFMRFHPNLLTYWAIVGFTQAFDYFQRYKERERQLAQAELHLLKSQLQPHFLFNALHTISAMMHEDVPGADRMVSRLSDLLRLTLDHIGEHEVSLRDELEFLRCYLEIERVRFQERLGLKLDVGTDTLDAMVPAMILQPFAENSIRHGFKTHDYAGEISVEARHTDGVLVLSFVDNGLGFRREEVELQPGLGLTNARRRLEQLYGTKHRLILENTHTGGASVKLEIPFHTEGKEPLDLTVDLELEHEGSGIDRRRRTVGTETDRFAAQN